MTQDEIIRMAREAGFETEDWANGTHVIVYESGREIDITNELERLVALVAAHEREVCAKACDDLSNPFGNASLMAEQCAAAIRARNTQLNQ